jgi:quinoprotein glucose dehydrogenase
MNRAIGAARIRSLSAATFILAVSCDSGRSGYGTDSGNDSLRVEWPHIGGDAAASHYSPLTGINQSNVSQLARAWEWRTPDRPVVQGGEQVDAGAFEATPVMVGDTLFLSTAMSKVVALDAETGRTLWTFVAPMPNDPVPFDPRWGLVHRGVAQGIVDGQRRIFMNAGPRLWALDAATGQALHGFGVDGWVSLTDGLRWPADAHHLRSTSPPVIAGDVVIVGSAVPDRLVHDRDPPGALLAFDVRTGARRWVWHTAPSARAPGSETWESGATERVGHANVWSPMTVDTARGLLFANVSAASNDFYGGRRKGANLYSESLVCLDAATGVLRWHFQYVHHGLWDYETAAPPMLITIAHDGSRKDIVAVPGKTGFLYLFDRLTGVPLWPIEERAVPASDVPGELASATQPHPTWPPPFSQQGVTEADLVDFTPRIRELALAEVRGMRFGRFFEPPSIQGTILLPGWVGGAGWGGGAFDPGQQRYFVKTTRNAVLARIVPADTMLHGSAGYVADHREPPHRALDIELPRRHRYPWLPKIMEPIPIVKPPYGTLAAYDLADGALAWNLSVGDSPRVRSHPDFRALRLPPLGAAGPAGPIVTAGGLVFVTGGGESLVALDARTGTQLWEDVIGYISHANPMTYRTRSGRQFVVVGAGSGDNGRLVAYTLPRNFAR